MPISLKPVEKPSESHVKLAEPELPAGIRSGGENLPLDYPHLYQIQAGDWRISYAVENNRLAILVLEVLNALGESSKDATGQQLRRNMKIKLLDWPEGSSKGEVPPEVVSNKMKIKWLDMADDHDSKDAEDAHGKPRIKFASTAVGTAELKTATSKNRITLLDSGEVVDDEADASGAEPIDEQERKVTPLDQPTM